MVPLLVHCHGTFSHLHYGHLKHLQAAKAMGERLWVTITGDTHIAAQKRPYCQPEQQRWEMLRALRIVDYCTIIYDANAEAAIKAVMPDVYVKGREYEGNLPEKALCDKLGIKVAFTYDEIGSRIHTRDLQRASEEGLHL